MTNFMQAQVSAKRGTVYELQWQLAQPQAVSVYRSDQPHSGYHWCGRYEADGAHIDCNDAFVRQYFMLEAQDGDKCYVSQRRFDLDGAPNVRDFGGYKTRDGGWVPWGRFYRAGRLSGLSEADIRFFHSLQINDIFDFRRMLEVQLAPHNIGAASAVLHQVPISPGSHIGFMALLRDGSLSVAQCRESMKAVYEDLALGQGEAYARLLHHLTHSDGPLLVNCSAGKDRTGIAVAKVLLLLGVDRDTIRQEYLLTARYFPNEAEYQHFEREFGGRNISRAALQPLMTVQPEYIDAYFDAIDTNFGSEDAYFEQLFGITLQQRDAIKRRCLV